MNQLYKLMFVLVLICGKLYAQNIQTYKGKNDNYDYVMYQYYDDEKTYQRIYHGKYKAIDKYYESYIKGFPYTCTLEINGQFKNDFKDGIWQYKLTNTDNGNYILCKGSFLNGYLNGTWTYHLYSKGKKQLLIKASFDKGTFIKDFYYSKYDYPDTYIIKGNYNDKGVPIDEWVKERRDDKFNLVKKEISRYKNGVLYWKLIKDFRTGEVEQLTDSLKFVNSFFDNCDTNTNISEVNGIKYILLKSNTRVRSNQVGEFVKIESVDYFTNVEGRRFFISGYNFREGDSKGEQMKENVYIGMLRPIINHNEYTIFEYYKTEEGRQERFRRENY